MAINQEKKIPSKQSHVTPQGTREKKMKTN